MHFKTAEKMSVLIEFLKIFAKESAGILRMYSKSCSGCFLRFTYTLSNSNAVVGTVEGTEGFRVVNDGAFVGVGGSGRVELL